MSHHGKVGLVTGAASGIGEAVARCYAREGAAVIVSDVNKDSGEKVADAIRHSGGEAVFVAANVSAPEDCERMVRAAMDRYGRLDWACNNAGIGGEITPMADYPLESWQRVIGVNLSGVFYCMKYEIPAMLKGGGGAIVNMSSILGQVGFAGAGAYVAAKHGVLGLTQNAAVEYARNGIRVNTVGPAFIKTPMLATLEKDPAVMEKIVSLHPMGRLGKPEEVAELVLWLSSEKASFVTGAYYAVDGGYLSL
jgi:NAD(P)-dependent dehydrogenase (short-subunit alcohol dehydrogenase family)